MSKKAHDELAAEKRVINYNKEYFVKGLNLIKEFKLNNFHLLDLGCGNGEFSESVKNNFNAKVTCLDYSETHLARIKGLGFDTIRCNFDSEEDINFLNEQYKEKFDIITSFEVIEHIFDVDTFLATIHHLLKKDGILIISTPNLFYFANQIYSAVRGNVPISEGHHIRFFDEKRFRQTLLLNGFDVLQSLSFGKELFIMSRAVGERKWTLRAIFIKSLFVFFYLLNLLPVKSSNSGLLALAKKVDVVPVALDPMIRKLHYPQLSETDKKKAIERLLPIRRQYFFDEHPDLRKFIDQEALALKII